METDHGPMHVGSVLVFDGSMRFEDFRRVMASRIHLVPRLRQRLVMVPLGIGKPYWVDDPDFDIEMHLQHVALPRPGNWQALRTMAARAFSRPLDRSRPLWEIRFVEGLDSIPQVPPGSVALISKVHHAAIDGVSGADMMGILFDVTKESRDVDPPPRRHVKPVPNELQVLAQTARKIAGKPSQVPALVRDAIKAVRAGARTRVQGLEAPPAPFSAPVTPLNHVISPRRNWNTALLSLDRVKVIKDTVGCTLNDVVLAICAGALRRYLLEKDALPDKPLVAMVPVSTRQKHQHGALGNQVSAMLVQLATDVSDPLERLSVIHEHCKGGKKYQDAVGAQTLADFAEFIPFGLAGQASRLYSRFEMAERHKPMFNVVITNVPGPQMDLYIAGHRLLATMGMAPIIDGMGLIITVLSYHGVISISPTSCPKLMPDIDKFARFIREAANELETDVLKLTELQESKAKKSKPSTQAPDVVYATAAFFERMHSHLQTKTNGDSLGEGVFQFEVTGPNTNHWVVALGDRTVSEGKAAQPDATLTIRDEHLAMILGGKLDPQIALVQGKLRIDGDIGKAIAFGALLPAVLQQSAH